MLRPSSPSRSPSNSIAIGCSGLTSHKRSGRLRNVDTLMGPLFALVVLAMIWECSQKTAKASKLLLLAKRDHLHQSEPQIPRYFECPRLPRIGTRRNYVLVGGFSDRRFSAPHVRSRCGRPFFLIRRYSQTDIAHAICVMNRR
jgi:hypothetical protein